MTRSALPLAALLLTAAVAPAQTRVPPPPPTPAPAPPRAPVQLRGPFGGVTPEQYYQHDVALRAGQLAAEVRDLRAAVNRSRAPAAFKGQLDRLADQAVRAADDFRRAAATADRGRLYKAHEPVDQAIERLVAAVRQAGALDPAVADAVARVQHADQQTHLAMTGGDATPEVGRRRAARLAAALDTQAGRLREMVQDQPAFGRDFDRAMRAVAGRADRLRQTLEGNGTMEQAAAEYRTAAAGWQAVAKPLTAGFATAPAVRLQAARVDGLFRSLAEVFPAAGGAPAFAPLPGAAVLARGTLAVSAGDTGGPRVRVFADHRANARDSTDFFAYDPDFRGGVRVAVADLNGDDVPDIVTAPGKGMPPLVRVFDGRSLGLMTEFMAYDQNWAGGIFVAAHDITRDGRAVVVTGTDAGAGPHVKAFDLAAGKELDSFMAYEESFRGGVRVALGDVDGDGFPDLVTAPGPGGGPVVKVFGGKDRAELATFLAFDERDRGGVYVAAADVAKGRRAEVIVGAGAGGPPVARVFDALRGRHLADIPVYGADYRGGVRVAAHDYDGDGATDFVCAPGPGGLPLRVFGGADRRLLAEFVPFEETFRGGVYVGGR